MEGHVTNSSITIMEDSGTKLANLLNLGTMCVCLFLGSYRHLDQAQSLSLLRTQVLSPSRI